MSSAADPSASAPATGRVASLAVAAAAVMAMSLLLAFRIPYAEYEVALRAQGLRLAVVGLAGFALAVAGGLTPGVGAAREAQRFAVSIGAGLGAAIGLVFVDSSAFGAGTAVLGLFGGLAGYAAARAAGRLGAFSILAFVVLAVLLLVLGIVATGLGATAMPGAGSVVLWLLGAPSAARPLGVVLACFAVVGLTGHAARALGGRGSGALLQSGAPEAAAAAALLYGLGVGLAGPVAFIGFFAPWFALKCIGGRAPARAGLLATGLVGAAALMLADALPRALVGGYALPLNVAIAVPGIPALLFVLRAAARADAKAGRGRALRTVEVVAIVSAGVSVAAVAAIYVSGVRAIT